MKKLTLAIMLGLGIMVSGCGHIDTTQMDNAVTKVPQKVECNYKHGDFGSYTASNPVQLEVGKQFGFKGATFNSKKATVTDDNKQVVYGLISRDTSIALYEVDVTNAPNGWDKLENSNNVYVVDNIIRERALVADLVNEGIYPIEQVKNVNDLYNFADITIVNAHIVHTHTKECK